jgi:SAM-dependent methyltransferase
MKFPVFLLKILRAPLDFLADPAFIKDLVMLEKIPQFSWGLLAGNRATRGYCPICQRKTIIIQFGPLAREHFLCVFCGSNPRQRALVTVLNLISPAWPTLRIFESSPGGISSDFLREKCPGYRMAHFFPEVPGGSCQNGVRCENLEALTFPDEQFDLVVTQDVMEHVLNPEKGFREIGRVLQRGGAHVFTVPYRHRVKTKVRAVETPGGRRDLQAPTYHGNPVDPAGSLVTVDWGNDLPEFVYAVSGMATTIYCLADKQLLPGVEPLEVFVSRKPDSRNSSIDRAENAIGLENTS